MNEQSNTISASVEDWVNFDQDIKNAYIEMSKKSTFSEEMNQSIGKLALGDLLQSVDSVRDLDHSS